MATRPIARTVTIVLATSTTISSALDLGSTSLVGLRLPSNFIGTALTFTCSDTSGGTFDQLLKDDGTAYTVTCAASKYVAVDYTKFVGVNFLKLVASTVQTTDTKTITCYARNLE